MGKRKSRKVSVLAQLLFPEVYADVVDALLKYMPYLKNPKFATSKTEKATKEISELFAEKASLLTFLAVGCSEEKDWDINEENGEEVSMCIFLPKESLVGKEREMDEEVRRCANYSFIRKIVADYARNFGQPIKRLPHYK